MVQKFHRGDWVKIAKNLGRSMSHFQGDCEAIVQYSYNDKYGGGHTKSYSLFLKGQGSSAWYEEHQLTLIELNRIDKLAEWEKEIEIERQQKSDLDWIFTHGEDVIKNPHGASVQGLANCFGLTNLWGSSGEGFVYYANAMATLKMAKPFLQTNDRAGWLEYCQKLMGGHK